MLLKVLAGRLYASITAASALIAAFASEIPPTEFANFFAAFSLSMVSAPFEEEDVPAAVFRGRPGPRAAPVFFGDFFLVSTTDTNEGDMAMPWALSSLEIAVGPIPGFFAANSRIAADLLTLPFAGLALAVVFALRAVFFFAVFFLAEAPPLQWTP